MPFVRSGFLLTEMTQFECICKSDPHVRGLKLILYQQLNVNLDNSLPPYTDKWAQDLQHTFEVADWSRIWMATKSASPNISALETNYKVLSCWYLVPARITKFVPLYSESCFRGCSDPGTDLHVWWQCPITQEFWQAIFAMASKALETNLGQD